MKRLKRIGAALILLTALLLGGCGAQMSAETLLQAPKPTGDREELQNAITAYAGPGISYLFPYEGQQHTAILLQPSDENGTDRAVVLYRSPIDTNEAHVLVMQKEPQRQWKVAADFKEEYREISSAKFFQVSAGQSGILVVWEPRAGKYKNTVYTPGGEQWNRALEVESVAAMVACDFEKDACDELFAITQEHPSNTVGMVFQADSQNGYHRVESLMMDNTLKEYACEQAGQIDKYGHYNGIVIDGYREDGGLYTQIVWYDPYRKGWKIKGGRDLEEVGYENIFLRDSLTLCNDINGDGIFEIPCDYKSPLHSSASYTRWAQMKDINTGRFTYVLDTVWNTAQGYYMELPKKYGVLPFLDVIFYEIDEYGNLLFYDKDSVTPVFEVCVLAEEVWEQEPLQGFQEMARLQGCVVAAAYTDLEALEAVSYMTSRLTFY